MKSAGVPQERRNDEWGQGQGQGQGSGTYFVYDRRQLLAGIVTIFTFIHVPRVQKTTYFFDLRRRTVRAASGETDWFC